MILIVIKHVTRVYVEALLVNATKTQMSSKFARWLMAYFAKKLADKFLYKVWEQHRYQQTRPGKGGKVNYEFQSRTAH